LTLNHDLEGQWVEKMWLKIVYTQDVYI